MHRFLGWFAAGAAVVGTWSFILLLGGHGGGPAGMLLFWSIPYTSAMFPAGDLWSHWAPVLIPAWLGVLLFLAAALLSIKRGVRPAPLFRAALGAMTIACTALILMSEMPFATMFTAIPFGIAALVAIFCLA